jgi:formylglycine-generating enzyme required for sulfatase activity
MLRAFFPRRLASRLVLSVAGLALCVAPLAVWARDKCPAGMVSVEGGTLDGPGRARARVKTFCLDRTEVTVDAYASCVKVGACQAEGLQCGNAATWGRKGLGGHPINCVTWDEAEHFCSEHGKRLPTEQEWEWAARGGARALPYPWGAESPGDRACWDGDGNTQGQGKRKATCAVGSHPRSRSADGVEDLAGNVREWTSTEHDRHRVLRGGSWGDSLPQFLAVEFRGWNAPDERIELTGFRCAAPLGAIARHPVRKPSAPKGVRAAMDDTGVLVFDQPLDLSPRREGKRR